MKKKIISLLLVLLLVITGLTGCGGNEEPTSQMVKTPEMQIQEVEVQKVMLKKLFMP